MNTSITELAKIREVVSKLLDELHPEAYVFDIEPQEGHWQLNIECAIDNGWESISLKANKDYLQHGDDAVIHQLLLDEWREALSACKIKTS